MSRFDQRWPMTADEFVERLSELPPPEGWKLTEDGSITRADDALGPLGPWSRVYGTGGMSASLNELILAAERNAPGHDPVLRARILAACRLA